jgi:hypothetical protein
VIKKPFHLLGLEVVRQGAWVPKPSSPPEPMEHPLEALYSEERLSMPRLGPAFQCDLRLCITENGFGYGPEHWHPYVRALQEYKAGASVAYKGSALEKHYKTFQPETASDLILSEHCKPFGLSRLSGWCFVFPWSRHSPVSRREFLFSWAFREAKQAGCPDVCPEDGHWSFGPVSLKKGYMEYKRIVDVFKSIRCYGYRRRSDGDGDITGMLLRRGDEYRCLIASGFHRLAAVAVLGYESIPVRIARPVIIEARDVDHWPQVRTGVYTRDEALAYFHYLFDFDSLKWAQKHDLV